MDPTLHREKKPDWIKVRLPNNPAFWSTKSLITDLKLVTGLGQNVKVSVAGGIKPATVQQVVDAGANIVVAGAAIYGATDPAAAAAEITRLARGESAGGGGLFGWL